MIRRRTGTKLGSGQRGEGEDGVGARQIQEIRVLIQNLFPCRDDQNFLPGSGIVRFGVAQF